MGLRDGARGGERHRDRVLGGGADVPLGRVRDDHAVFGGGVDIDVVDADPGAPDDDEVGRGLEDRLTHVGPGANDERVDVRDGVEEGLSLDVVGCFDLVTRLAEGVETGVRDRIRDEYLHVRGKPTRHFNAFRMGAS